MESHLIIKTTPYDHQVEAIEETWDCENFALLWEMGTGKTLVGIASAAKLWCENKIRGLAIVAPKGVYRVWAREIKTHLVDEFPVNVVVWTPAKTLKQRERMTSLYEPTGELRVFLINVEALSTQRGGDALHTFLKAHDSMLIIDESTSIKTPSAERTKTILRIAPLAKYRRIMTGSPITKSPLDLYTQCFALSPDLLGFGSYYTFRNRFLGKRKLEEVIGYRHLDELTEKMSEFSSRVTKEDCLDLPPKIYETVEVEMSADQRRVYENIRKDALAKLGDGQVSVHNVLTQLLRLHQVCCGFVSTDEGEIVDLSDARYDELMRILESTDEKVIIWATYRHSIQEIVRRLDDPAAVVSYYGDTSDAERECAIQRFQEDKGCRFFVGNPSTAGYGLTLTAASMVVYFSNDFHLEKRLQSEDRAHRIGQDKPVLYLDMVCPGTVDERIVEVLRAKKNVADVVMGEDWRDWI